MFTTETKIESIRTLMSKGLIPAETLVKKVNILLKTDEITEEIKQNIFSEFGIDESNIETNMSSLDTSDSIREIYEYIISLEIRNRLDRKKIESLTARVEALEGGN